MEIADSGVDRNRVLIFDTTLRDGEQSSGATMTEPEKLEMADMLVDLGVDIIEAGFPAASPASPSFGSRRSSEPCRRSTTSSPATPIA